MYLIDDIREDKNFIKSVKIIGFMFLAFFILDNILGIFLTKGLEKYYGLKTDAKIALVGHSHLMLGVDKNLLEKELKVPVADYTRAGVNIADRKIMIEQLLKQNTKLQIIIYGIDAWSFTGEGLSANSYTLFYPFLGTKEIDSYVKSQTSFFNYWLHKLVRTSGFDELLVSSSFRGYLHDWSNLKIGHVDTMKLRKVIANGDFRKIDNSNENINILKQSIKELENRNIKVILLYIPTIDIYNQAEPEKFKRTLDIINSFTKEFTNVSILNYLEPYSHDYSLFFDPIHMNPEGQKTITMQLIKDLKSEKIVQ